ncbi:hypothetical protein [Nonomuraea longicatena]|uniref:Secreted protein n=1 Tax=Nonomuraea longicatena TaxID=83682 RepID=A0ABP4BCB1_9ACTN
MRTILIGLSVPVALSVLALTVGAAIYLNNEPDQARAETTSSRYELDGDQVDVETNGAVDVKVKRGDGTGLHIIRTLRWTGNRHHSESWSDNRLTVSFDCERACSATYEMSLPQTTRLVVNGKPS